eukprot:TRINITY_DN29744_c0_g1_i1.p2 TRINITY_DN29744_c0_g1~~TRINITY_DN29744_c0_g1_i1.p2  ORF type:complete len:138 (-),score=33.34 TRINITY_DN29744_c0_g1_i1:29-442(-)
MLGRLAVVGVLVALAIGFLQATRQQGTSYSIAWVTAPDQVTADQIAQLLLTNKLAACVNVLNGVQTHYMWQGDVQQNTEFLLMVKTRADLVPEVISIVKSNHPVDVPEIVTANIAMANPEFLDMINLATQTARRPTD